MILVLNVEDIESCIGYDLLFLSDNGNRAPTEEKVHARSPGYRIGH